MSLNLNKLKPTEEETSGVWLQYVPGVRLKIASMSTHKYRSTLTSLVNKTSSTFNIQDKSEEVMLPYTIKAIAECILVGWEGLIDDDGKEVPYSVKQAEEYLTDVLKFYMDVTEMATNLRDHEDRVTKETTGN